MVDGFKEYVERNASQRNKDVVLSRLSGMTYAQISELFGFTINRGRQIFEREKDKFNSRFEKAKDISNEELERLEKRKRLLDSLAVPFCPLCDLDISFRTFNQLSNNSIHQLSEVVSMTDKELMALPNFGKKSLAEIRRQIDKVLKSEQGSVRN